MSTSIILFHAAPSNERGGTTRCRDDQSPLAPTPPPLPRLPAERGFPPTIADTRLIALTEAACAAAPDLRLPLHRGRWTFSEVERIASLAVTTGVVRQELPELSEAQEDRVCIAATRRLHHLLAVAHHLPGRGNLLAWQLCHPSAAHGSP